MSDKFHAGSDFVRKAAREAAELAYQSWVSTQGDNSKDPNWFIGKVNSTKDKITHPNGTQYNLVFTGQVTDYCLAYIVDSNTAYGLGQEKNKVLNTDGNNSIPYVIYRNFVSGIYVYYMTAGTDTTVSPIDMTGFGGTITGGVGNWSVMFSSNDKSILIYQIAFGSGSNLTISWSIISNFQLTGGVWTGTLSHGNFTFDQSQFPTPSIPVGAPTPPPTPAAVSNLSSGILYGIVEQGSGLATGGLYLDNSVMFWKDNSNNYHFGLGGLYNSDAFLNQQVTGTSNSHTLFRSDNTINGRYLLDVNLHSGAQNLQFTTDETNNQTFFWSGVPGAPFLNGPNDNKTGYLPNNPASGLAVTGPFFRSQAGIYSSNFQIIYPSSQYAWATPWNQGFPATVESNYAGVFTDTEYLSLSTFGSLSTKATDSEQFIAINPNTSLQKYFNSGSGVTAGKSYGIGNVGLTYDIVDWAVY